VPAAQPPSTAIVWPVVYRPASLTSHSTAPTTSSARPSTGSGVLRRSQAWLRSSSYMSSVISLRKNPGATVLTRMRWRAHWTASSLVSPDRPALLAAYDACGMPGMPTSPLIDETFTIAPRPAATMCGCTAWASRNGATRLSSSVPRTTSTGSSSAGWTPRMAPAAFTRISGPPSRSATSGTSASSAAASTRSQATARPPTSPASDSRRSRRRATTATRAPADARARATAAPRPDDAPVTTATRPARSNIAGHGLSSGTGPPCQDQINPCNH
jgi:hypothetical protein